MKKQFMFGVLITLSILFGGGAGLAQSGIGGAAPLILQQGVSDCNAMCPTVDVFVGLTGLSGAGGEAGLNGFVLAFDLNRSDVFASAIKGDDIEFAWNFFTTQRSLVDISRQLILAGASGDAGAPNQIYHLATLVFCGAVGTTTLTFDPGASSLGSRVVNGDGPGPIQIQGPSAYTITITSPFSLDFYSGLSTWLNVAPDYDLVDPVGNINILDLVKLIACGQP